MNAPQRNDQNINITSQINSTITYDHRVNPQSLLMQSIIFFLVSYRSSFTICSQYDSYLIVSISPLAFFILFSITQGVSVPLFFSLSSNTYKDGGQINKQLYPYVDLYIFWPPCRSISRRQIQFMNDIYLASINYFIKLSLVSTIKVSMNFTIFCENIFFNLLLEFFFGYKVVLSSMHFSLSRPSCCIADTQFKKLGVRVQQKFNQCALPNPRTATDNQWLISQSILLIIKVSKKLFGVFIDIFRLLQET